MHSSKEQHSRNNANDSLFGMALGQVFMASVLGPVADMVWEAAETASAIYTDRFQASVQRTNGRGSLPFAVGVKHSLENSFARAQTKSTFESAMDLTIPYWKRDAALRLAA